jgi:hypothetical protein
VLHTDVWQVCRVEAADRLCANYQVFRSISLSEDYLFYIIKCFCAHGPHSSELSNSPRKSKYQSEQCNL